MLLIIFSSSCKKEDFETNNNSGEKTIKSFDCIKTNNSTPSKVPYVQTSKLVYIGNSQWWGDWNGIELIFSGPTDYQLMEGLNHYIDLVSARSGSMNCEFSSLGDRSWSIVQIFTQVETVKVNKVDWKSKATGVTITVYDLYLNDYKISTTYSAINPSGYTYERIVSSYFASTLKFGSTKQFTYKITVLQVDDHLEIMTYNPKTGNTTDPTDPSLIR